MQDMLVRLYDLPEPDLKETEQNGYQIRRAMAPDRREVVAWVEKHSGSFAAGECETAFSHTPISCFLATKGADIVGYACYDATAPDFFGPTRVQDSEQGKGLGRALLLRSLHALKEEGYGYAIIGGVGPAKFYEKCCGAMLIPGSDPGIYKDFLGEMKKGSSEDTEDTEQLRETGRQEASGNGK
ncbi:MAG: GNAT family N-acetyltransferase [Lachnospiraceae bacterium]|nr:GNAT family N-acetyltransferase [Lachnospiraceae bacterium]